MIDENSILATINSPDDLKKLKVEQLPELSSEIAQYIKYVVKENGGHYSSPLGVVDLAIAMHYVFDSPEDRLIWDVGHQAYAHKILTGRRDSFSTLRTKDGTSGFLKRVESEHDIFGAGHASTAISAGVGVAEALKLRGDDKSHVVAIVGDGAMTGGLSYEGLNNLGSRNLKMTVILNDNKMSISPSVGSLSKYLTRIVTNPIYNRIRDDVWKATGLLPIGTNTARKFLKSIEEGLKSFLTPGMIFEELGLRYFGPIDGHDHDSMINVFQAVKAYPYPTLVHILTKKGHGAQEAELDSLQYYSMPGKGKNKTSTAPDYSKVFGKVAVEMAARYDNVVAITAAMEVGTGLSDFVKAYPDRYYDVGLAEEHAVTFAAGLAVEGVLPIVAIYSTFSQRAFDQVMHDIALQNLPVIFCLDRGGVVGPDGPTHHGVFDLALFRSIPGVTVCAPKDGNELRDLMFSAVDYNCPVVIRYPKAGSISFNESGEPAAIVKGSWEVLREGGQLAILATGSMVAVAQAAAEILAEDHDLAARVVNARFIKPLDESMLDELAAEGLPIVTAEEGLLAGGFGSGVQEYYNLAGKRMAIGHVAIADEFTEHGTRDELLNIAGLTKDDIVQKCLAVCDEPVTVAK